MMLSPELRAAVREAYNRRCGYCGVSEIWVGGELEIDHFHPLRYGGTDALENLVYACTMCNRFKSDYWPSSGVSESLHLLHSGQDNIELHLAETIEGRMIGLTPRGWFYIERLHLNRSQLIEMRRLRYTEQILQREVLQAQTIKRQLQARIRVLEAEIAALQETIARLIQEA